jgi:hypothetical protein
MTNDQDEWLTGHAWVDGAVIAIDEHTWAIHGVIPVDGEVLLAEYSTAQEARAAVARATGS